METSFVHALLSGDPKTIFGAAAAMVLSMFGAWIIKWLVTNIDKGIDYLKAKWDANNWGKLTEIGDRFFAAMHQAIANQTNTSAAIAASVVDGTVTDEEWAKIATAAWEDFKANLSVKDWMDFGLMLIGAKALPGDVEKAVKAKFMANVRAVTAKECHATVTRMVQSRQLRQCVLRELSEISRANPGLRLNKHLMPQVLDPQVDVPKS